MAQHTENSKGEQRGRAFTCSPSLYCFQVGRQAAKARPLPFFEVPF